MELKRTTKNYIECTCGRLFEDDSNDPMKRCFSCKQKTSLLIPLTLKETDELFNFFYEKILLAYPNKFIEDIE